MAQTQEYELNNPPQDGISNIVFAPGTNLLLVSSWDASVRLYDAHLNIIKGQYRHKAPVLDCCFSDKSHAFSGGLDRTIKHYDLLTNIDTTIGEHDKAVRCVVYSVYEGLLASGGWDATVRLWDTRTPKCVGVYPQPERVFSMAVVGNKLVVGTAGRLIQIYDTRAMGPEPEQRRESSLKYQTRCIRAFVDNTGYALSSIEGRVAMEYLDPSSEAQAKKYAFKCHRTSVNGVDTVYPVNSMAFHQQYGTFATGGGDGMVNIWDGQNRKRLCQFHRYPTSIASLAFDTQGSILAIAASYTFEEGERDHPADAIFIRKVSDAEVKPKAKGST